MNKVNGILELQNMAYQICADGYGWKAFMSKNLDKNTPYPYVEIIEAQFIPGVQKGHNVGNFLITIHVWNTAEEVKNHGTMVMRLYESLRRVNETTSYEWQFEDSQVAVTFVDDTTTGNTLKHAVIVAPYSLLGVK